MQSELASKLRDHALLDSASGAALLPLAALVSYKGVYSTNAKHVAALAAGGFAAYGVTQYLTSHPRELIYVSGIATLDCAIMVGLTPPHASQIRSALQTSKDASHALSLVDNSPVQLNLLNPGTSGSKAIKDLAEALGTKVLAARARKELADIRVAEASSEAEDIDGQLRSVSLRIVGEVNRQIATLTPDPNSIQSKLTSLALPKSPPATKDVSAPRSSADPSQVENELDEFLATNKTNIESTTQSIAKIRSTMASLARQSKSIKGQINAHLKDANKRKLSLELNGISTKVGNLKKRQKTKVKDLRALEAAQEVGNQLARKEQNLLSALALIQALEDAPLSKKQLSPSDYSGCGIKATTTTSAMSLGQDNLALGANSEGHVTITGGDGFYRAMISNPPKTADNLLVSISDTSPGHGQLNIKTGSLHTGESYTIVVTDPTVDQKQSITLTIK